VELELAGWLGLQGDGLMYNNVVDATRRVMTLHYLRYTDCAQVTVRLMLQCRALVVSQSVYRC